MFTQIIYLLSMYTEEYDINCLIKNDNVTHIMATHISEWYPTLIRQTMLTYDSKVGPWQYGL